MSLTLKEESITISGTVSIGATVTYTGKNTLYPAKEGQINAIESVLLKHYLGHSVSPQQEMKMIFAIGGAAKLLISEQSDERIQMTIRLVDKVIHS